jgi:tRNA U34 2-thiouridine synthase MnmA/TrmU
LKKKERYGNMTKAVALLSGGLDSTLAVKMIIDQGIEVHALNFTSAFCTCTTSARKAGGCKSESRRVAEEFGIPIKVMLKGDDYMDVVRDPAHGYGKGMNPCVDCRIYMFKAAKKYMDEIGASFILTGEVLGQRPMSQRRDSMRIIERESGLDGLILRPLCAGHLEPTIAEKEGLVDRKKLLSVAGRGRRPQMDLAEELGVNDYPCPSGGCLLTDVTFSKKVRDLFDNKEKIEKKDLMLLKIGRHLRHEGFKIIVGRDEADNARLKTLVSPGYTVVEPATFPGPLVVITGKATESVQKFAGGLILRYASAKTAGDKRVRVSFNGDSMEFVPEKPVTEEELKEARVCG